MAASLKQPSSATSSPPPPQPQVNTEQYNEDEALARAIAASLQQDAKSVSCVDVRYLSPSLGSLYHVENNSEQTAIK